MNKRRIFQRHLDDVKTANHTTHHANLHIFQTLVSETPPFTLFEHIGRVPLCIRDMVIQPMVQL